MLYEDEKDAAAQAAGANPRPWRIVNNGRQHKLVDAGGKVIREDHDDGFEIVEYLPIALNTVSGQADETEYAD